MYFKNSFILSLFLLGVTSAQLIREEAHPAPEPYSFAFESPNEDGSSSARQETGDANGRIQGFYIIKGADGQDRRVDYVADENGFHADVSTNEIGTVSHEAASAIYKSSAPSVAELIAQWESSGASAAAASRRQRITESGASRVATRIINTGAALNLGGTRLSTIQTSGGLNGATAFITKPALSGTVAISASQRVTPEGYVLVPASAARTAGIQTFGPEYSNLQIAQNNYGGLRTVVTKPVETRTILQKK